MKNQPKTHNRTTMNIIAYLISLMLCFTQASGCIGIIGGDTPQEEPQLQVSYELPAPWEISPKHWYAILNQEPHNRNAWFVKIETTLLKRGKTNKEAYNEALNTKQHMATPGVDKLTERSIAGTTVYVLEGENEGEFSGGYTALFFIRDGWIVWVALYDDYPYYKEALEQMVRTYQVKELK